MLSAVTARHKATLVDPMTVLRRRAATAVDEAVALGLTEARFIIPFGTPAECTELLEEELQALGYTTGQVLHAAEFKMIISWKLDKEESNEPV